MRQSLDSVNDFAKRGYNLRICCEGCGHTVEASAVLMLQELHARRASRSIARLEQMMKCRSCGHRGAAISACETNF
jgi:primosomal protein N'